MRVISVQPSKPMGDIASAPIKKCKYKASVASIGEFKRILKVVPYIGPNKGEGEDIRIEHKYLIRSNYVFGELNNICA